MAISFFAIDVDYKGVEFRPNIHVFTQRLHWYGSIMLTKPCGVPWISTQMWWKICVRQSIFYSQWKCNKLNLRPVLPPQADESHCPRRPTPASFSFIFIFFVQKIILVVSRIRTRIVGSRRRLRWPLDHHHGPNVLEELASKFKPLFFFD